MNVSAFRIIVYIEMALKRTWRRKWTIYPPLSPIMLIPDLVEIKLYLLYTLQVYQLEAINFIVTFIIMRTIGWHNWFANNKSFLGILLFKTPQCLWLWVWRSLFVALGSPIERINGNCWHCNDMRNFVDRWKFITNARYMKNQWSLSLFSRGCCQQWFYLVVSGRPLFFFFCWRRWLKGASDPLTYSRPGIDLPAFLNVIWQIFRMQKAINGFSHVILS